MAEATEAQAHPPTGIEMRMRIVAAVEQFISERSRDEWRAALSSHKFHLVIDDGYMVSVAPTASPIAGPFLFADPLAELRLDAWAVELGGGVKDAALDTAAESALRKMARAIWWVP
jgi:hypothetical protein